MLESALISSVKKSWSLQNGEKLEKIKKEKKVNSAITRFGHDVITFFYTRRKRKKKKISFRVGIFAHRLSTCKYIFKRNLAHVDGHGLKNYTYMPIYLLKHPRAGLWECQMLCPLKGNFFMH